MSGFTHFDEKGAARMVNVGGKPETERTAKAAGTIHVGPEAFRAITEHTAKKGDVLGVARIAGIMGAKRTAELIPLCHIVPLTGCTVEFTLDPENFSVTAVCETACTGRTGVEMEALTGVQTALLTVYDMCKALNRGMRITDVRLLEKDGGKSGHFKA